MTSEYANRTLGAKTPSMICRRTTYLLRASPHVRLSDQASRTSSRAKLGTHADGERKEGKRRSARVSGTGEIEAYALCSFFTLHQTGSATRP